jgi:transcriptional regulator with XRE-family HTH domain
MFLSQIVNLRSQSPTKRLKHLLIESDLSLQDLAAATGISISLIKKIASGERVPTQRAITRIENVLGRIWSTPAAYRARQKKLGPSIIEFDEAPSPQETLPGEGITAATPATADAAEPPNLESPTDHCAPRTVIAS